ETAAGSSSVPAHNRTVSPGAAWYLFHRRVPHFPQAKTTANAAKNDTQQRHRHERSDRRAAEGGSARPVAESDEDGEGDGNKDNPRTVSVMARSGEGGPAVRISLSPEESQRRTGSVAA